MQMESRKTQILLRKSKEKHIVEMKNRNIFFKKMRKCNAPFKNNIKYL